MIKHLRNIGIGLLIYLLIPFDYVDSDIKPYYDNYQMLLDDFCPNQPYHHKTAIKFSRLDGNVVGLCRQGLMDYIINIDILFWQYSSNSEKEALVFHELTHCILHKEHTISSNHYMNEFTANIDRDTLYVQTSELMREVCK